MSGYGNYVDFKGWRAAGSVERGREFEAIMRFAPTARALSVLEIGFGAGDFLEFARGKGHSVAGTEVIPELVARARVLGHDVWEGDLVDAHWGPESFDLIVAIDVFEHLRPIEVKQLLSIASPLLRQSGRLVARFPNGDSPWVGRFQNGDLTHVHTWTSESVRQVTLGTSWRVLAVKNFRMAGHGPAGAVRKGVAHFLRDLIEVVLGFLYFGYRFPMDPNVIVVLECSATGDVL